MFLASWPVLLFSTCLEHKKKIRWYGCILGYNEGDKAVSESLGAGVFNGSIYGRLAYAQASKMHRECKEVSFCITYAWTTSNGNGKGHPDSVL